LLSWIYLNYENKLQESLFYCKTLNEMYPENDLYLAMYVRNLLLMKKYNEAEKLIPALPEEQGINFSGTVHYLKGNHQEKGIMIIILHCNIIIMVLSNISLYGKYGMNMLHMLISV